MLTSEGLLARWNGVAEVAGSYTRIDAVHPLELYLGYEGVGQRVLLLISPAEPPQVPSSKSVLVHVGHRNDGRWAVSFRLVKQEQEEVFMQLCCDLIESSREQADTVKGAQYLLDRYKRWHKLMEHQSDGLLSDASRKGLIGELLFLQRVLVNGMYPVDAVAGWMGPEKGDRDFVYANGWHEVKTVGASAKTVSISSLEQLDAAPPGELVVCFVDRTAPGDTAGFSLNHKVSEVRAMVEHVPAAAELFDNKVTFEFGYVPLREYDTPVYRSNGIRSYSVNPLFPRLTRGSVPVQLAGATYELSLSALEDWRTE